MDAERKKTQFEFPQGFSGRITLMFMNLGHKSIYKSVAKALELWELDHKIIYDKAVELGIERLLGVSLLLCQEFCGSQIPESYHEYLESDRRKLKRLFNMSVKHISGTEDESLPDRFRRNYYFLLLKPGLLYRWTVIKSLYHRWYIRKFLGGH